MTLAPESEDATEVVRATADLVLGSSDPPLSVIVENQRRIDVDKPFAWMRYLAVVHARRRGPTFLVVFTTDAEVAAWAARPIATFQPGSRIAPIVLGPGCVPRIASAEEATRSPELALLSVMAHGRSELGEAIARAALVGAASLDDEKYRLYTDRILAALAPIVSKVSARSSSVSSRRASVLFPNGLGRSSAPRMQSCSSSGPCASSTRRRSKKPSATASESTGVLAPEGAYGSARRARGRKRPERASRFLDSL
ncbi:MAG: hypothetical protein M3Y87_24335 [Myxococcota bacterium]|nr:hypothetical protein [Myxococcota bacterium]